MCEFNDARRRRNAGHRGGNGMQVRPAGDRAILPGYNGDEHQARSDSDGGRGDTEEDQGSRGGARDAKPDEAEAGEEDLRWPARERDNHESRAERCSVTAVQLHGEMSGAVGR